VARIRRALAVLSDPQVLSDVYLGVVLEDAKDDTGAVVATLDPSGPGARAGLLPGDRIVACGPEPVSSVFSFNVALLENARASQRLAVVGKSGKRRGALLNGLAPRFRRPIRERMGLVGRDVTPAMAWRLGQSRLRGVQVTNVEPGGPADGLGIRAGDIILKVATKGQRLGVRSTTIHSQQALAGFLTDLAPKRGVMVTVRRKGRDFWGELRLR
jgi:S1-C subfamily serine protease